MIKAVVYTSETGHTKRYAELAGKKTGLPVYELKTAVKEFPEGSDIVYMGWLMAGKVKGFKKAEKYFKINAVCGVGMSGADSQITDIRKANNIAEDMPVFYLQGGFEPDKLHGIYKVMMNTMKGTAGKALSGKDNRTPEEDDMLDILFNGGDRVSADDLSGFLRWYEKR